MKWWIKWVLLAPLLLALAACGGLSGDIEARAGKVKNSFASLLKLVESERTEFANLEKDAEAWAFFAPYATRENWAASFDTAAADVKGLQKRFDTEVRPLLTADREEDEAKLAELLTALEANYKPAEESIKVVKNRMTLLKTGFEKAPEWIKQARQHMASIDAAVTALRPVIETTKKDFVDRATDIDMRFAPLSKFAADAKAQLALAEAEFGKHESGSEADYAVFADAVAFLKTSATTFAELDTDYRADLDSLYKDFTLVLRDMKVEYAVTIGRSSWYSDSDWDSTNDYLYSPAKISQADFEYLSGLGVGEGLGEQGHLASYSSSWGSWSVKSHIDAGVWNRLGLNADQAWFSGDDDSMFFIEDLEPVYFHKYAEISGTNVTEGDWEEVDEDEYGARIDDFGMSLETKPLGKFDDEAVSEATPVGIDMVGDARYGEWQQDSSGNSFWHYYGQYAFFNNLFASDNRYYRSDYDDYRRWRNDRGTTGAVYGWYGTNRSAPTWGSSGAYTTTTSTYKSSPFAANGGAKSASASLRSAGETARTRGPGEAGK